MSEDPFYCGETFEKVEEVSPREKIWRVKTEKEFDECGDLYQGIPSRWNDEGLMSFLYGKTLDEIFHPSANRNGSLDHYKELFMDDGRPTVYTIVGEDYRKAYPRGDRSRWNLSHKDFTFDYPV
jgi:hypothetical protein